jgi:ribosomal-protein-alanine N-acetyltransferase
MNSPQDLDIPTLRAPLLGERVLLRPFTAADISETYVGWLKDPEVVRYSNQRFRVHTLDTCRSYLASFEGSANYFLAICDRQSGAMLGTLTVYRSVPHSTADIGILIGARQAWGQGIGAEAFCLVVSTLKASGAIRKITAGAMVVNRAMVRILEKAGMYREATRRAQELLDGEPVDVVYHATFNHD